MSTTVRRVAFVGLGNMGDPIAANLVRAGFDVVGVDAVPGRAAEIVAAVESVSLPAPTATNAATRDNALRNRLRLAIYLAMVSPEWLLQS